MAAIIELIKTESEMAQPTNNDTLSVLKKKLCVMQRYREDYSSISYPVIIRSSLSQYNAYCNVCKADFSVKSWRIN